MGLACPNVFEANILLIFNIVSTSYLIHSVRIIVYYVYDNLC